MFLQVEFPWAKTTSNPYLPPDLHPEPCHRRCRPDGVTTFHLIHRGLDTRQEMTYHVEVHKSLKCVLVTILAALRAADQSYDARWTFRPITFEEN